MWTDFCLCHSTNYREIIKNFIYRPKNVWEARVFETWKFERWNNKNNVTKDKKEFCECFLLSCMTYNSQHRYFPSRSSLFPPYLVVPLCRLSRLDFYFFSYFSWKIQGREIRVFAISIFCFKRKRFFVYFRSKKVEEEELREVKISFSIFCFFKGEMLSKKLLC